jgi:SAM-dependent methyltransferase
MLFGARLARLTEEEAAEGERVRAETAQRFARLKDQSGYWQGVALTRMGAYVTAVEERFIVESLRANPPDIVLDVGAASGRLEHALAGHADHVIASDLDRDEVYAMADDERVTPLVVSSWPAFPLRTGVAGLVTAIEAPNASDEHWFRDECGRVLTPGGRVVVTVYNARSYKALWLRLSAIVRRGRQPAWAGLYYRMSLAGHIRAWREAGFEVVRSSGFYWSPLSRSSDSSWVSGGSALERSLGLRLLSGLSPWVMLELRKASPPDGQ